MFRSNKKIETEVGVSYETDVEALEALLQKEFIPDLKKKYADILEGDFTSLGVSALADSSVTLKFGAKVKGTDRPKTIRLINREFKIFCD
ncbi:MAG: hypothetical protein ACO3QN_00525 [Bacilli bacterium]